MSEESIMHWKRESCGNQLAGTASANTSSGYFVKTEGVAGESSSSLSLSGPPSIPATSNLPSEIFAQHQQQLELQKISNSITKMNSLPKLSGLDGIQQMPEEERLCRIQQIVEAGIGDHAKQTILQILDKVSLLKPPERLLLYLRMPGGTPETDPLRQPQNPLGTRSEINHTINWVRSHLEHDPKVSIPKQDVYNDYVAYCDRVDIKPLSTADFGKVMKQVFPEIRPRRLGTRGHSRYCYAAMRKATKLDPPKLPDLGANSNLPDFNATMDEDSWKIIKMWAEGLLNSSFDNTKDLATHITKHHLNSPASNSSRLLLQKKLLQRDAKEKRKYGDNSPMKKRRKKKRKSSSSSESTQQMNSMAMESTTGNQALLDVKKEADASTPTQHLLQQKLGLVQPSVAQLQQQQKQKNLPINLVTEHDNNVRKIQGTNLACDNNLVAGCTAKNLVAQSLPPMCGPPSMIDDPTAVAAAATAAIAAGASSGTGVHLTSAANVTTVSSSSGMPQNLIKPTLSVIKEELPDDYHSNILCKKVRQAQQSKRLWNPSSTSHNPNVDQTAMMSMSESAHNLPSYPAVGDSLMAPPPTQMDIHMEHVSGFKRAPGHHGIHGHPHAGHRSSPVTMPLRAKKLRYIHAKLEAMQQQRNEANDNNGEKDVLPENLGIPRERVISICNMDKHELDDYLNEEDNSQDQEAELLQYFQAEAEGKGGHDQASSAQMVNSTNSNNYSSMGENYQQYYGGGKFERKIGPQHDQDEINQLRYYLHQNLQTNKSHDPPGMGKTSMEGSGESYTGMYPGGSASASLAMMSQRHLSVLPEDPINLRCCNEAGGQMINNAGQNSALRGPRRKINLNARSCVPNSPNTRRKNFSFVPISPTTSNNNNSIDFSPFVSPRSTPVVRKPPLHKQQSLPLSDQNITDPMMAATSGPDFGKSLNFQNAISASAPPSPSLVQQRFRYAPTSIASVNAGGMSVGNGGNSSMGNGNEQYNHFQSVAVQCRAQNSNSLDGMTESRSQSVPLHCRNSPGFGHSSNYPGFSSQCSSVAQTPVPPEFADFSDASILDIFADTAQQNQPVKLETNDMVVAGTASTSILDSDISTEIGMADFLAHELNTTKGNNPLTSVSRSVPSTPLPLIGNFKSNVGSASNAATSNSHGQQQQGTAGKLNKMYDISKSVPTTPVAMSVAPFRYSPEFNRDFLINGNTIETGKMSAFYNQQQSQQSDQQQQAQSAQQVQQQQQTQQSQHGSIDAGNDSVAGKVITTSLTEGIDELSNFGDVTESIIGSDILNNL